jgi:hypothetical protein
MLNRGLCPTGFVNLSTAALIAMKASCAQILDVIPTAVTLGLHVLNRRSGRARTCEASVTIAAKKALLLRQHVSYATCSLTGERHDNVIMSRAS